MDDQAHFRLFELPYDLIEYVSLFFDTDEARKLLTVSGAFHDLFARRVWWKLDSRVFTLSEPARSAAIARYGRLVRDIDLDYGICSAIESELDKGVSVCDTLSVFSGVTTLKVNLGHSLHVSDRIQFVDMMMCFPSLYKLFVVIEEYNEPYDLVALAHAIGLRRIEYLCLRYSVRCTDNPWTRLSHFVQLVLSNCAMKIEIIPMSGTPILPSQSDLQILSKYIVERLDLVAQLDVRYCYATINRSWFWKPLDQSNSCIYPQLRQLSIRTCCASSDTYDYCDFVPSNFPRLQSMDIIGHECSHMVSNSYSSSPAWQKVLLQSWPHLKWLKLSIDMTCEQLVTILEYNCRLTYLRIWLQPKMLDDNNKFNMAIILPLLPQLQQLSLSGSRATKLDYSPGYNDSDVLARSHIRSTSFFNIRLSTSIFKLQYSLPRLNMVSIQWCKFYSIGTVDVDAGEDDAVNNDNFFKDLAVMINVLSEMYSSTNPCAIKEFNLRFMRGDPDWPLDIILGIIELMPKLQRFGLVGSNDKIRKAVKERFPHIKVLP
ncbi:hypothetical protein GQ42DRAFT_165037 [Ramicandelaber brevisporus]|nr:hypothetical protein GQ42DRAFT_165037 [Ramicandelaber brevisporus]